MEELVLMHQKEREAEINKYSPLQQILPQGAPVPTNLPVIQPTQIPSFTNHDMRTGSDALVNAMNHFADNCEKLRIMMEETNKTMEEITKNMPALFKGVNTTSQGIASQNAQNEVEENSASELPNLTQENITLEKEEEVKDM